MELTERISQLLEEKFSTDEDFADCFVVEVDFVPVNKLQVFIDSDSGMPFSKCQKISRHLEGFIDSNDWLGEKYILEVSSPGIDRPLKFVRQYQKNVGRKVRVSLLDESEETGLLKAADETQIVLGQQIIEREGKKKKKVDIDRMIPLDQIEKTIVIAAFK